MRKQHLMPTDMEHMRRPLPLLIGHAASGLALALLFVSVLYLADSALARLLREAGGVTAFGALFLLHAALFTCASLATATGRSVDCGGSAAVGDGICASPANSRGGSARGGPDDGRYGRPTLNS
jgi:hypothetical protein